MIDTDALKKYMKSKEDFEWDENLDAWVFWHKDRNEQDVVSYTYVRLMNDEIYWGYTELEGGYDEGNCESSSYKSLIEFAEDFE